MKRIGVFLDVADLYYCINRKFRGRKLDYKKYLAYVQDLGEVQRATAYGTQLSKEAAGFIHCLKKEGYTTRFKQVKRWQEESKRSHWDAAIAVDAISMLDRIDKVILGSASDDLVPLVEHLVRSGVDVIVIACNIHRKLREVATDYVEIPESLLEG